MNLDILNHINKGQVVAIIPARSGSKGVKDKNIRLLNGHPMIAYTIAAAKLTKGIDRVIVSTDSEKYAEIARKYGAETPFLRPAEISGDKAKDVDFIKHAILWFYENEGSVPEFWVHPLITCPFRKPNEMDEAISNFVASPEYTSLISASQAESCAFKLLVFSGDNEFHSAVPYIENDDVCNPRQSFPKTYFQDGYISIYRTEIVVNTDKLRGTKMMAYVPSEGIDIDTENDFRKAEEIIGEYGHPLLEYLNSNYDKE